MLRFINRLAQTDNFVNKSVLTSCLSSFVAPNTMINQMDDANRMVWIDLELTGLDIDRDLIMEIGCLVTDGNLQPIGEGVNLVIHQPDAILVSMNNWCKIHHGQSGLTEECRQSKISLKTAESTVLEYVQKCTIQGKAPIAGNSVHEDRRFLLKHMPQLMDHFHYRIVDVSSIKELCRRWYPEELKNGPDKKFAHRCLSDVYESIAELAYYRKSIFKQ
ncbi:Oligoribonuclease, mitochondrial [Chamberlinius hualienensis]